jgi:hypothetical protein
MKGDFSRDTFDRRHRFSRVLMQQGRVLLDADWNEQAAILLHFFRTLAADLIGPHGGPGDGFRIGCPDGEGEPLACDFTIAFGHYYVDGILLENEPPARCGRDEAPALPTYLAQPDYPDPVELEHGGSYLVYLDVWERHITHLEVDHVRELALGGPDTATRSRVVWQVKVADEEACDVPDDATCAELLAVWVAEAPRCLRARARVPAPSDDPCIIPPEARYRGSENQLYRVEIHEAGEACGVRGAREGATFKWSRDNGSIVFPVLDVQGAIVTLGSLGPDGHRGLEEGVWVELEDDRSALRGEPGVLARVDAVDRVGMEVTLDAAPSALSGFDRTPLLRRWDQGSDAIPVREGSWIDLEDGVQVYFEPGGAYRTGDYWLVPARRATGDVLWPSEVGDDPESGPRAVPPHGIEHRYAPLGRIVLDGNGVVDCDALEDCRCVFPQLCPAPPPRERTEEDEERVDDERTDRERRAELVRIAEVGDRRAERLMAAGFTTAREVASMSVDRLREVLGVSEAVARTILESSRAIAVARV